MKRPLLAGVPLLAAWLALSAASSGCCADPGLELAPIAPVSSWPAAAGRPPPGQRVELILYNVKFLPVVDADDEGLRSRAIPEALWRRSTPDLVVLCEAFDLEHGEGLLASLARRGLRYASSPLGGAGLGFAGGVRVASRWPILREAQQVFPCGVIPDAFADKGVVYLRVAHPAGPLHLFALHLQSPFAPFRRARARELQREQLALTRRFVEAQQIPLDEPVIVAGDFNLGLRDEQDLGLLLHSLQAELPALDLSEQAYTYDGTLNTLARAGAQRWVDHVLLGREHLRPRWSRVRPFLARDRAGRDLSDHLPVQATLVYARPPGR